MKIKKINWFTLVEVIIIVMILAILATISFISFRSYTKDTRDANRAVDVTNVWKGLNLYYAKTNKYPLPDNVYSTWVLNAKIVSYLWYIGENVSRNIDLSKIPVDPFTGDKYLYAINFTKKQYQIAQSKEWQPGYFMDGNYKWILASESVPSLIYLQTGSIDLTQSWISYIRPEGLLVGSGITHSYVCSDLTDAQVAKLDNMVATIPIGNRFAYSEILSKSYNTGDPMTKEDWCAINDLSIWNTSLSVLPSEIRYLNWLNYLTISENASLTSLPSWLSNLTNLQILNIQNNPVLTSGLSSVAAFPLLRELQISGSPLLWTLPDGISTLSLLESLDLSKIWITSIPRWIWKLTYLWNLSLACNNLTWLPSEISNLKQLQNFNIWGGYGEVDCGTNSWLKTLAANYDVWSDVSEICDEIPNHFCIETNSITQKIILSATSPFTCAAQTISNANYTLWFPSVNDTPWQNIESNDACYYKCKVGYTGNDCLTVVPLTLFDRLIIYLQETSLPVDPWVTFGRLTEYNGKLYFQDSQSSLYSIDSNSVVEKILDSLYLKPIVFNGKLYAYRMDWNTEISYLTSIDSENNKIDWPMVIPRWYVYDQSPLVIFNDKLFFRWETSNWIGKELYYIDNANVLNYIDINPTGSAITNINGMWYDLWVFNNKLYFWADAGTSEGDDLFSLDINNNLVSLDINPSWDGVPGYEPSFQVFNNKLYFNVSNNGVVWEELYYINSLGGTGVIDINPGISNGNPHNFFVFNNKMYFKAMDATVWWELFSIDENENIWINDLNAWPNASNPRDYFIYNNKMYFIASLDWGISYWFYMDQLGNITQIPLSNDFFGGILGMFDDKLYYINYNTPKLEYYNLAWQRNMVEWINLVIWY